MTTGFNAQDMDKLGESHFVLRLEPALEIGAFREISGLQMEREVLEHVEGGNNTTAFKLPGRTKYVNLVLKRGVTDQGALLDWFTKSQEMPVLRVVTITLVDTDLTPKRRWVLSQAYPVKWIGPTLNAGSDSPATEQLELAYSGLAAI